MLPAPRPKTSSSIPTPKTDGQKSGGLFQTVVFSRKNTSHGPDEFGNTSGGSSESKTTPKKPLADLSQTSNASALSSIVHQTDRNGKQHQSGLAPPRPLGRGAASTSTRRLSGPTAGAQQGSFRNLFANIWSALGISEQQHQQHLQQQSQSVRESGKTKAVGSSRNVVELRKSVIPPLAPEDAGKKCLVLDLDETLVHSSFKPTTNPDYIIPVDIDGTVHQVYVCKRPGAEKFLVDMAKHYEIVVYTASLSKYADPLLDQLDPERVIRYRLFREHCVQYEGNYVKDLSLLDRDLTQAIIIDNSPMSYMFHPRNAIGCSSFIDDMSDRELDSISRFLVDFKDAEDVRNHLHTWDASY